MDAEAGLGEPDPAPHPGGREHLDDALLRGRRTEHQLGSPLGSRQAADLTQELASDAQPPPGGRHLQARFDDVVDDGVRFDGAEFSTVRVYRRDLLTGDSAVVLADAEVPRLAARYAAAHPDERPLDDDEEPESDAQKADEEQIGGGLEGENEEIYVFPGSCSSCGHKSDTYVKKVNIPYFKDILIMSVNCDKC